jgi:toxin CcdB
MAQFDVHPNPIRAARAAYPWVAVVQSPLADASRERIVAPLVRRDAFPASAGRLTPVVEVDGATHVLLVPGLAAIRAQELGAPTGSLARHRVEILAAIDYLFFGV